MDKSQAASVSGTVKLDGTAPKPTKIDMSQDAACKKAGGENMTETVVADNGNLANVEVMDVQHANPVSLVRFPTILVTKAAMAKLEELFK